MTTWLFIGYGKKNSKQKWQWLMLVPDADQHVVWFNFRFLLCIVRFRYETWNPCTKLFVNITNIRVIFFLPHFYFGWQKLDFNWIERAEEKKKCSFQLQFSRDKSNIVFEYMSARGKRWIKKIVCLVFSQIIDFPPMALKWKRISDRKVYVNWDNLLL